MSDEKTYEQKYHATMRELVQKRAFYVILTDCMRQIQKGVTMEDAVYIATEALRMTTPPSANESNGDAG